MKVGSDNSVYSLFTPTPKKPQTMSEAGIDVSSYSAPAAPAASGKTDSDLVAEFHARLAKSAMQWADTNKDGKVDKGEYTQGRIALDKLNERETDLQKIENDWNVIDKNGTGSVDENGMLAGVKTLLPVSVGHFSKIIR